MSRFGETADRILETLQKEDMMISELRKKFYLRDTKILNFLEEYGFIEFNMDYVSITRSGMELLTVK
jgi:hypothetical protein